MVRDWASSGDESVEDVGVPPPSFATEDDLIEEERRVLEEATGKAAEFADAGGDDFAPADPVSHVPSLDEYMAAFKIDGGGYVTCPLRPFDELRIVGRHTVFGESSMAMWCYAHAK